MEGPRFQQLSHQVAGPIYFSQKTITIPWNDVFASEICKYFFSM
jgi:hypothetical protein